MWLVTLTTWFLLYALNIHNFATKTKPNIIFYKIQVNKTKLWSIQDFGISPLNCECEPHDILSSEFKLKRFIAIPFSHLFEAETGGQKTDSEKWVFPALISFSSEEHNRFCSMWLWNYIFLQLEDPPSPNGSLQICVLILKTSWDTRLRTICSLFPFSSVLFSPQEIKNRRNSIPLFFGENSWRTYIILGSQ